MFQYEKVSFLARKFKKFHAQRNAFHAIPANMKISQFVGSVRQSSPRYAKNFLTYSIRFYAKFKIEHLYVFCRQQNYTLQALSGARFTAAASVKLNTAFLGFFPLDMQGNQLNDNQ